MRKIQLLGAVLTLSLIAAMSPAAPEVTAQDLEPVAFDAIYFPWVPNSGSIDGAGPWYGSITVMNVDAEFERRAVRIWIFDGQTINRLALGRTEDGGRYELRDALDDPHVPRFDLDPNASLTLSAAMLNLPEPGSPVAVFALFKEALDPNAEFGPRAPVIAGIQKQAAPEPMTSAMTTGSHLSVDGYSAIPFSDVPWGSQSEFCYMLREGVDSCDGIGLHDPGQSPLAGFDGHSYLPIVQTNTGWNTEIYLSNVDFTAVSAAQVSLILTESGSQDSGSTGPAQVIETVNIPPGGTAVVDARALVGDGWIGSARITSTVGVASLAMRSKPADSMLMINTAAPSLHQASGRGIPYDGIWTESATPASVRQYAPLVFRDYHGWNTGFSFVNIAERPNRVTVSYRSSDGRVMVVDTRTIPARGHEFIYIPAHLEPNGSGEGDGFAGSAVFEADYPFHVAIDQVKYSTGEAMSYLGVAAGARAGESLLLPLVQKGWQDGTGDTSGFQIFNPSQTSSAAYELRFFDSAGASVGPTRLAPLRATVGPREIKTIYTLNVSGMPQNQRSSAVLTIIDGEGWLVGVSNNVNYAVGGDGSAAFNMVNLRGQYRLPEEGGSDD